MKTWTKRKPTKEGTYQMKDGDKMFTIFVEKFGSELGFRIKGQPFHYSFMGTEACLWKWVRNK